MLLKQPQQNISLHHFDDLNCSYKELYTMSLIISCSSYKQQNISLFKGLDTQHINLLQNKAKNLFFDHANYHLQQSAIMLYFARLLRPIWDWSLIKKVKSHHKRKYYVIIINNLG